MSTTVEGVTAPAAGYALPQLDNSKSTMGKDAFLKLLVAQMTNQDPMAPTSNENMILQLAQMSTFESIDQLNTQFKVNAGLSSLQTASNLIGRQVSYAGADGAVSKGIVEKVEFADSQFAVVVNGEKVSLADITSIENNSTATASAASKSQTATASAASKKQSTNTGG